MDRKCNACGEINRGDARFCKSCGSPLPAIKVKMTQQELAHEKQVKKFWLTLDAAAVFPKDFPIIPDARSDSIG